MITEDEFDHLIKVVIIGNSNVGKSNLSLRYTKNMYDDNKKNTIGVDFFNIDIVKNGKKLKVQLWDTAGQEK